MSTETTDTAAIDPIDAAADYAAECCARDCRRDGEWLRGGQLRGQFETDIESGHFRGDSIREILFGDIDEDDDDALDAARERFLSRAIATYRDLRDEARRGYLVSVDVDGDEARATVLAGYDTDGSGPTDDVIEAVRSAVEAELDETTEEEIVAMSDPDGDGHEEWIFTLARD